MGFSADFVWGVASAAYQIEGAAAEDGRTPTIWDTFSHTTGTTFNGHTGDVACDYYHRFAEDIELIASAGLKHYRFGIAWTRIFPYDNSVVNQQGLNFYDKVVELCLKKGIEPWITLYHWDLPQYLEDKGGWLNRATADAFAHLAATVAHHFKGRVTNYFTLNEPQCSVGLGYGNGQHAPGKTLSSTDLFYAMHNLALAHGKASLALRKEDSRIKIGIATTGRLCYPASSSLQDLQAAKKATFTIADHSLFEWVFTHHWFLDAIMLGHYPAECAGTFLQPLAAAVSKEDWEIIHQPADFIGLNVYNGHEVYADSSGSFAYTAKYPGYPRTALKWPVTPAVLRYGVNFIYSRYHTPIYISENGQSCNDRIMLDGHVHDPDRIDFLHRYLQQLSAAIADGTDVKGYFHWSLTDNYEWHSGYDDRFGLIFVDYLTQQRIPKDSYYWYAQTVSQNGQNL
ncbi:MAG: GH1 family beta-glucosidase [Oscillospiraceae bacterium]|nr:GH1 family beta-glucosidase [Oscillospiraceae bacterium]